MRILGLSGGDVTGHIWENGKESVGLSPKAYNQICGKEIAYISAG